MIDIDATVSANRRYVEVRVRDDAVDLTVYLDAEQAAQLASELANSIELIADRV